MSKDNINFDNINNLMNTLRIKENDNIKLDKDTVEKISKLRTTTTKGDVKIGQSSSWSTTYIASIGPALEIEGIDTNEITNHYQVKLHNQTNILHMNSSKSTAGDGKILLAQAAGSNRFAVYNTGKVAIGEINNPTSLLHVRNTAVESNTILNLESSAGKVGIEFNLINDDKQATKWEITRERNENKLYFTYGTPSGTQFDNNLITFKENGYLGIKTINPEKHLEINDEAPYIRLQSNDTSITNTKFGIEFKQTGSGYSFGDNITTDWKLEKHGDGQFHIYGESKNGDNKHKGNFYFSDKGGLVITREPSDIPTTLTGGTKENYYLMIGRGESAFGGYRLIGFGYHSTIKPHPPAFIGFVSTGTIGGTMGDLIFGTRESGANALRYNGAPIRMIIKSSGKVGIGTTTPQKTLDVNGDIAFTGDLYQNGSKLINRPPSPWTVGWPTLGPGVLFTPANRNVYFLAGNVGIGTTSPSKKLDVVGDISFTGKLYQNGKIFTSNHWTKNSDGLYLSTGNVGIGTTTPQKTLDVVGDIAFSGDLYKNGIIFTGGGGTSLWTENSSNIYFSTGNVGIGTTSPSKKLDVNGDIAFTGKLYQNGSIFTSNHWTKNNDDLYLSSGNVGIGTTTPTKKLHVVGDATFNNIDISSLKIIQSGNEQTLNYNTLTSINANINNWNLALLQPESHGVFIQTYDKLLETTGYSLDVRGRQSPAYSFLRFEITTSGNKLISAKNPDMTENNLSIYSGSTPITTFENTKVAFHKPIFCDDNITVSNDKYISFQKTDAEAIELDYSKLKNLIDNLSTPTTTNSPWATDQTTTNTGNLYVYNSTTNLLRFTSNGHESEHDTKIQFYSEQGNGEVGKIQLKNNELTIQAGSAGGNNGKIKLMVNKTNGIMVHSNGNVSIGQDQADEKLHVNGSINLNEDLYIENNKVIKCKPSSSPSSWDSCIRLRDVDNRMIFYYRNGLQFKQNDVLMGQFDSNNDFITEKNIRSKKAFLCYDSLSYIPDSDASFWSKREYNEDNKLVLIGWNKKVSMGIKEQGFYIDTNTEDANQITPVIFQLANSESNSDGQTWEHTMHQKLKIDVNQITIGKDDFDTDLRVNLKVQGTITGQNFVQHSSNPDVNSFLGETTFGAHTSFDKEATFKGNITMKKLAMFEDSVSITDTLEVINGGPDINTNKIPDETFLSGSHMKFKHDAFVYLPNGLNELSGTRTVDVVDISSTGGIIFNKYVTTIKDDFISNYYDLPTSGINTKITRELVETEELSGNQLRLDNELMEKSDLQKLKKLEELTITNSELVVMKNKIDNNLKPNSLPLTWIEGDIDASFNIIDASFNIIDAALSDIDASFDVLSNITINDSGNYVINSSTSIYGNWTNLHGKLWIKDGTYGTKFQNWNTDAKVVDANNYLNFDKNNDIGLLTEKTGSNYIWLKGKTATLQSEFIMGVTSVGNRIYSRKYPDAASAIDFSINMGETHGDVFRIKDDKIGININPRYSLDVRGDINFIGNLYKNGNIFTSNHWRKNSDNLYFSTGNVGIGTQTPSEELDVNGTIQATTIKLKSDSSSPAIELTMTKLNELITLDIPWNEAGDKLYYTNKVGIGNNFNNVNMPTSILHLSEKNDNFLTLEKIITYKKNINNEELKANPQIIFKNVIQGYNVEPIGQTAWQDNIPALSLKFKEQRTDDIESNCKFIIDSDGRMGIGGDPKWEYQVYIENTNEYERAGCMLIKDAIHNACSVVIEGREGESENNQRNTNLVLKRGTGSNIDMYNNSVNLEANDYGFEIISHMPLQDFVSFSSNQRGLVGINKRAEQDSDFKGLDVSGDIISNGDISCVSINNSISFENNNKIIKINKPPSQKDEWSNTWAGLDVSGSIASNGNLVITKSEITDPLIYMQHKTGSHISWSEVDTEEDASGKHETYEFFRMIGNGDLGDINSVSFGMSIGAYWDGVDWTAPPNDYLNPYGKVYFNVNGRAEHSNNFGETPDNSILTLIGNGKVGINTENPSLDGSGLEVVGDISSNNINIGNNVNVGNKLLVNNGENTVLSINSQTNLMHFPLNDSQITFQDFEGNSIHTKLNNHTIQSNNIISTKLSSTNAIINQISSIEISCASANFGTISLDNKIILKTDTDGDGFFIQNQNDKKTVDLAIQDVNYGYLSLKDTSENAKTMVYLSSNGDNNWVNHGGFFGIGTDIPTNKLSVVLNNDDHANRNNNGIVLSNLIEPLRVAKIGCSTDSGKTYSSGYLSLYDTKHEDYDFTSDKPVPLINTNVYLSAENDQNCYINNKLTVGKRAANLASTAEDFTLDVDGRMNIAGDLYITGTFYKRDTASDEFVEFTGSSETVEHQHSPGPGVGDDAETHTHEFIHDHDDIYALKNIPWIQKGGSIFYNDSVGIGIVNGPGEKSKLIVNGDIKASDGKLISNTLRVSSTSEFQGAVSIKGELNIAGNTTLTGQLDITNGLSITSGGADISGGIDISGDTITDRLYVNGDVNVKRNLGVSGNITIDGETMFNGNVNSYGIITAASLVGDGSQITNLDSELSKLTDVAILDADGGSDALLSKNNHVLTYDSTQKKWVSSHIENNKTFTNYLNNYYNTKIINTNSDWIYFNTSSKKLLFTDGFDQHIVSEMEKVRDINGIWTKKESAQLGIQYYVDNIKVGIGNPSPIYDLDVNGTIRASVGIMIGSTELSTTLLGHLKFLDDDIMTKLAPIKSENIDYYPTLSSTRLVSSRGVHERLSLKQNIVSEGNGITIVNNVISSNTFQKNGDYIYYNNNVGIGTNVPSEKLEIIGSIKANSLKLSSSELTSTILSYITGLSGDVQDQLDGKQDSFTSGAGVLSISDVATLQIKLDGKQSIIRDGDLTIARTSGLQAELDGKHPNITTGSLSISHVSALQTKLDEKQNNITTSNKLNIDYIDGLTSKLSLLTAAADSITAPYSSSNLLPAGNIGIGGVTNREYDNLKGLTSNIQIQINTKQAVLSEENPLNPKFIAISGNTRNVGDAITGNEFGYLSGLNANIQTQLDLKAPINNTTFTGKTFCEHPDNLDTYGNNRIATAGWVITKENNLNVAINNNTTAINGTTAIANVNQRGIFTHNTRISNIETVVIANINNDISTLQQKRIENTNNTTSLTDDLNHLSRNFNTFEISFNDLSNNIYQLDSDLYAFGNDVVENARIISELQTQTESLLKIGTSSDTAMAGNITTISQQQALDITNNKAKKTFPGFGTTHNTVLRGDTKLFTGDYKRLSNAPITITAQQTSDITKNTSKVSFPGFGNTGGKALDVNYADNLYVAKSKEESITENKKNIISHNGRIQANKTDITKLASDLSALTKDTPDAFNTLKEIVELMGTENVGTKITKELNNLKFTVNTTLDDRINNNVASIKKLDIDYIDLSKNFTQVSSGYDSLNAYVRNADVTGKINTNIINIANSNLNIINNTESVLRNTNKVGKLDKNYNDLSTTVSEILINKQDKLTIEKIPTKDSDNIVSSGALFVALGNKQDTIGDGDIKIKHIADLTNQLSQIVNNIESKQDSIVINSLQINNISELSDKLSNISIVLGQKQSKIVTNSLKITDVEELETRLIAIETFDSGLSDIERAALTLIPSLESRLQTNETAVSSLREKFEILQAKMTALETQFSDSDAFASIKIALEAISNKELLYDNAKSKYGEYPYHGMAVAGDFEELEEFNTAGIDIDILDDDGQTPLHKACSYGKEETVKLLVGFGANINTQDNLGATPIMLAAANNNTDIVIYLMNLPTINLTMKKYDGNDITTYIWDDTIEPWLTLRNFYNTQNSQGRLKQDAIKRMLKMDKSNISEKDFKSLIDINMNLIDIIQNKLNL